MDGLGDGGGLVGLHLRGLDGRFRPLADHSQALDASICIIKLSVSGVGTEWG